MKGAASDNRVYLQEYETKGKCHKKNKKQKTALSKVVGVEWCDVHNRNTFCARWCPAALAN